ncbi:prolyl oligopeptidase family serine peptidase [Alteromonas sp. 345S023]|uniref:Prolyl oligopeptidase family serine peptidase n=1 Tax=Alteromonas profundi TaxID=2696062 RepID=A0A7X5LPY4_9ALTE|nr:prolyl oligopeptidase family serine peptidase [Alteromonas profundi]NDV92605.1 prolyl oligopeptidase family serine peptidase [Alteromonas profundi]
MARIITLFVVLFVTSTLADIHVPTRSFVQLPDVVDVQLSPSGNRLAMLKRVVSNGERLFVVELTDLESGKKGYPVVRKKHEFDVYNMVWASDEHLLLQVDFFQQLKIENTGFNPKISERRLMILNINKGTLRNVLSKKTMNRFQSRGWQPQFQDTVVDLLPHDPEHILHALDWNARQTPQVFKVNLNTLARTTEMIGKENWSNFVADRQGNVRAGIYKEIISGGLVDTKVMFELHVKDEKSNKWRVLARFEQNSDDSVWPLGFTKDPNILLVKSRYEGRDAIYKIDLKNADQRTLFYANDTNISGTLFYSNKTNNPVGYITNTNVIFWDEEYQGFKQRIDAALPNTDNRVISFDKTENKYLVFSKNDVDSGTYYLGNRKEKSLLPIAYTHSGLDPANLAKTTQHTFVARDGTTRNLFVTLPPNLTDEPVPSIVYVTEGIGDSRTGGFDFKTQLWANRGYAVVQINFRRPLSGYYGFMHGDVTQWAPTLYNDVADAYEWGKKENIIDPQNTCVFGQHFAGYIALMARAHNPSMFQCAATIAPVTDINNYLFANKGFTIYEQLIAGWSSNGNIQQKYSPISYADQVATPTFIAHGEDDGIVRVTQSQLLSEALSNQDVAVKYVEIPDEDSYFSTDESRLKVYSELEAFFASSLSNNASG